MGEVSSIRCPEGEGLLSFRRGGEMSRDEGRGLAVAGVREAPTKVRLVECFEFFGLFLITVFDGEFTSEQTAGS